MVLLFNASNVVNSATVRISSINSLWINPILLAGILLTLNYTVNVCITILSCPGPFGVSFVSISFCLPLSSPSSFRRLHPYP